MSASSSSIEYHPPSQPLVLVHLDDALIVVEKPAGLLSVPGRGPERVDCAASRVLAWAEDALVVHRLDMSTSGLMLFARGKTRQSELSRQFMNRQVDKRYVAVVRGCPVQAFGEIELPLLTDWPRRPRQKVDWVAGKPSLTRWRRMQPCDETTTYLELEPVTGRSHQLRVHLSEVGHPILGDELYGPESNSLSQSGRLPRLHLHATELSLIHPITGLRLAWVSKAPF